MSPSLLTNLLTWFLSQEYIHRVGRTARGVDAKGHALLFLTPDERGFLQYLKEAKVPLNEYEFSWSKVLNIQPQVCLQSLNSYFICSGCLFYGFTIADWKAYYAKLFSKSVCQGGLQGLRPRLRFPFTEEHFWHQQVGSGCGGKIIWLWESTFCRLAYVCNCSLLTIWNLLIYYFVTTAVSNSKVGRSAVKARRKPGPGQSGSNYNSAPYSVNKRKIEKSVIFKAVPLKKDNRVFSSWRDVSRLCTHCFHLYCKTVVSIESGAPPIVFEPSAQLGFIQMQLLFLDYLMVISHQYTSFLALNDRKYFSVGFFGRARIQFCILTRFVISPTKVSSSGAILELVRRSVVG